MTLDNLLKELDESDAACGAATEGPWYMVELPRRTHYQGEYLPPYVVAGNRDPHLGKPVIDAVEIDDCTEEEYNELLDQSDADLKFCCSARTQLPRRNRQLRTLIDAWPHGETCDSKITGCSCDCGRNEHIAKALEGVR